MIRVTPKFFPEHMSALLIADEGEVDLSSKQGIAKDYGLLQKKEFHVTLINYKAGKTILGFLEKLSEDEKKEKTKEIEELCSSFTWQVELKPEYYFIEKTFKYRWPPGSPLTVEERGSIIQMAEVLELEEFYQKLNNLLGMQFEAPVSHLTLFTNSSEKGNELEGIAVHSWEHFKELNPRKI